MDIPSEKWQAFFGFWWAIMVAIAIQTAMQNSLVFNLLEADFAIAVRKADYDIHNKYKNEYEKVKEKAKEQGMLTDYDYSIISIHGYLPSIDLDVLKDFQRNLKEEPLPEKFQERKVLDAFIKSLKTYVFGEATTDIRVPIEKLAANFKDELLYQIYRAFYQEILKARENIFRYRIFVGVLIILFILKDAFYFYFVLPSTSIASFPNKNLERKKALSLELCKVFFIVGIISLPIIQVLLCTTAKKLLLVMFVLFIFYILIDVSDCIFLWINSGFKEASTKYAHWIILDFAGIVYFLWTKSHINSSKWHEDLWLLPYSDISRNVEAGILGLSVFLLGFLLMFFLNKRLSNVNLKLINFLQRKVKITKRCSREVKIF